MNVRQQQIRTSSVNGALAQAGFNWAQPIAWRERYIIRTLWTSASVALATSPLFLMWVNDIGKYKIDLLSFVILAAFVVNALAVVVWMALMPFNFFNWAAEVAAVSFNDGQEIWVTKRRRLFHSYLVQDWMCLRLDASEIASIERVPMQNRAGGHYRHGGEDGYPAFNVCIYFMNGERFFVATYLDEPDANVVVAQLGIALREVRILAARAA